MEFKRRRRGEIDPLRIPRIRMPGRSCRSVTSLTPVWQTFNNCNLEMLQNNNNQSCAKQSLQIVPRVPMLKFGSLMNTHKRTYLVQSLNGDKSEIFVMFRNNVCSTRNPPRIHSSCFIFVMNDSMNNLKGQN